MSKKLIEKGHEVTVYTTDGFKKRLDVDKNVPVDVDGITTYYFRNLSSYLSREMVLPVPFHMAVFARKEMCNFDIVHIHEYRSVSAIIASHYARNYGIPYVLQAHGSLPRIIEKQRLKRIFDWGFGNRILADAAKLIALTERETEQYRRMGANKDKVVIVPNGIDWSEYDTLPRRGEFRKRHSIADDERIILSLGRIHRIKGLELLIEAFSKLVKRKDDVKLVVAGPDDGHLSSLKRLVGNLKIHNKVIFPGPIYGENKLELFVDSDVFVSSSVYETFPVTILEACACGVPVIVTDRCQIADIISERMGYKVGHNANDLRDAILMVLSDEGLRKESSREGRQLIQEEFDWDTVARQIENVYIKTVI